MATTMSSKLAGSRLGERVLSGRSLTLPARPANARPARSATVAAEKKPSIYLDKPGRLWELDETWYPGASPPEYLDGSHPGDRGFDPAGLFANPASRPWLVEGELYNGRVAMFAAAGILFTEAVGLGPWWSAPFRADWPLPYAAGVILFHAVYGFFELKRFQNFQKYEEGGLLNMVPFDPLNMRSDTTRKNEVRNGRLAMLANLGFWSQAAVTGKGPLQNLSDHIADPTHNNIFSSRVGLEVAVACVFIGIVPIVLEVQKDLDPKGGGNDGFRPLPFL